MDSKIIDNVASPVSKSLVDELVTPIIKKLKTEYKKTYNDYLVPRSKHFKKYLDEAYNEYSTINTLVFHDRIKSLKEIYLPLTLIKEQRLSNNDNGIVVNGIPVGLVKECRKLLIIDTAGMGKSTMLKRMFLDVNDIGLKEVGIPLFVDLRRLKKDWTIIDEIGRKLSSLSETFDEDLLRYFLEEGGFIFFLDGYDEISLNDKDSVTQSLQDFMIKAENNFFILTSRPEPSLSGFSGFITFKIKPLKKEEAYSLLKNYDLSKNKEISTRLIDLLRTKKFKSASDFLENPLLTTLLYNAFDYKQTIPIKKHLFYRQVYDAYFDAHDLKKGDSYIHEKSSHLDIDEFCRMLRFIGYHSLRKGLEYSRDEISETIEKAKKFCGNLPKFSNSSFLKDITTAVPLFCEDGSKYKWVHKSLMEYFAAMFISNDIKNMQDSVLSSIFTSNSFDKYINMLDLYYDIDYKGFSKNITLPLCECFMNYYEEQMADDSIKYIKTRPSLLSLIEERVGLLFLVRCAFLWDFKYTEKISFLNTFVFSKVFHEQLDKGFHLFEYFYGFHHDDKCIWFAIKYGRYFPLVELLFDKKENLFVATNRFFRNFDNGDTYNILINHIDGYEQRKAYEITMSQGLKSIQYSIEYYKTLNDLIKNNIKGMRLSYAFCKAKVDEIHNDLSQSENVNVFIEGI